MTSRETRGGIGRLFVFVAAFGMLQGCAFFDSLFDPPGKGSTAEAWFARCQPIIDSLENYKASNHHYPDSLSELVPAYVAAIPDEELKQGTLRYQRHAESYELKFTYYGPGVNYCISQPGSKWVCRGYY